MKAADDPWQTQGYSSEISEGQRVEKREGDLAMNDTCNGVSRSSNLCIGVGGFWYRAFIIESQS